MSQHEEMIVDMATLHDLALEPLTPQGVAAMLALVDQIEGNLDLAAGAAQALGKATSFS